MNKPSLPTEARLLDAQAMQEVLCRRVARCAACEEEEQEEVVEGA